MTVTQDPPLIGRPRIKAILLIAVFVLFMGAPFALQFVDLRYRVAEGFTVEQTGSGELRPAPWLDVEWGDIRTAASQIERELEERFSFGPLFTGLENILRLRLEVPFPHPDYLLGEEGWIYFNGNESLDQHRGVLSFSSDQLDLWMKRMEARQAWLAWKGAGFLVAVAPSKMTVYPEYLPDHLRAPLGEKPLDQLMRRLEQGSELNFVDLRARLLERKDGGRLFPTRDTHWNNLGAFLVSRDLMIEARKFLPDIVPLAEEDFVEEFHPIGSDLDIVRALHLQAVSYEIGPRLRVIGPWADMTVAPHLTGLHPSNRVALSGVNERTLLIIGDSYAESLLLFLPQSFGRVYFVHHLHRMFFEKELIDELKPDLVIYQIAERFLLHGL